MPIYNAPVEEMMFLFDHLKDNKNYKEIDKYKEINSDLVKDILQQAAKINQELILPLAKIGDEKPCVYENGIVRSPPGYKEAYKNQLYDFAKFVKKNIKPLAKFEEGRRALIMANAAKKSLSSKKFEKLNF